MPKFHIKGYVKIPLSMDIDASETPSYGALLHRILDGGVQGLRQDWEIVIEGITRTDQPPAIRLAWFPRPPVPKDVCPNCGKLLWVHDNPASAVLKPMHTIDDKGQIVCLWCTATIGDLNDDNPLPTLLEETYTERPEEGDLCPVCDEPLLVDGNYHYFVGEEGDIYCGGCGEAVGDLSLGKHWPEGRT